MPLKGRRFRFRNALLAEDFAAEKRAKGFTKGVANTYCYNRIRIHDMNMRQ